MAAGDILYREGTKWLFRAPAGFNPSEPKTNWATGTTIDIDSTMANLVSGGACQSAKIDFGNPRPRQVSWFAGHDFASGPTIGQKVSYFFAPSLSGVVAESNVAGNSGEDNLTAPHQAIGGILLLEFLEWCLPIGDMVVHDGTPIQNAPIRALWDVPCRYGQLITYNQAGANFANSPAEHHVVAFASIDQYQDS